MAPQAESGLRFIPFRLSALNPSQNVLRRGPEMAFHISRWARRKYQVPDNLFTVSGNVFFADFHATRVLAQAMNDRRDLVRFPETSVRAGLLNCMGLVDEILHHIVHLYRVQVDGTVMGKAMAQIAELLGAGAVEGLLRRFLAEFPPPEIFGGHLSVDEYLSADCGGMSGRETVMEEVLMLWVANMNPAFAPFRELFDDAALREDPSYLQSMAVLQRSFQDAAPFGPDSQDLVAMLRSPAMEIPHSITGQLDWIRDRWGLEFLRKHFIQLLNSLDMVKEEEKMSLLHGDGPGPTPVFSRESLSGGDGDFWAEPERFSPDLDWMPRLVLMAKCVYVWLDQLSKEYGRPIAKLDEIPDGELDRLSRWGVTGLWLIGVWERSRASKEIKRMCGNPEALASAYSLKAYEISEDLGGATALDNLRRRAWARGVRLAADMVPNHMGVDSPWVAEHPEWFLQLDHSPYPAYSFGGPNLSGREGVGVFIEDHYFDRTDAAVVFKWVETSTGKERFIYHGNDGTRMPWNDTAQLDYLISEVREQVIQTILNVARQFPVIRFDAAMTLAKRHYQRLWFPEPGSGGDIPTRAGRGMGKAEFDRAMPAEFWREVVDRVAAEAPDTLLLAEAFWLMEGYFVRTLGMHRVYNSAFMNFLKNEDNEKFRASIRNVLEFNPEILKRFVNFMNNPDEDTAVAQFGSGDKYFGVATLMVTMPGLPMLGHGQVEGYTEKYGMEYRKAYWDESPDADLVRNHERLIFPLMRKRHIFADVRHFLLFDLVRGDGSVNENVIAYSNGHCSERALVVYNNAFGSAEGRLLTSAAYLDVSAPEESRSLVRRTLGEGLQVSSDPRHHVIFRDHVTGLQFVRNCSELCENGFSVKVDAYKYHVYMDFEEIADDGGQGWADLCHFLNGRGVPSLDEAKREMRLRPLHDGFATLLRQVPAIDRFAPFVFEDGVGGGVPSQTWTKLSQPVLSFLEEALRYKNLNGDLDRVARAVYAELHALAEALPQPDAGGVKDVLPGSDDSKVRTGVARGPGERVAPVWLVMRRLMDLAGSEQPEVNRSLWDECRLGDVWNAVLQEQGESETSARRLQLLLRVMCVFGAPGSRPPRSATEGLTLLKQLFHDADSRNYIQVNRHQNQLWFNRECFRELVESLSLAWTSTRAVLREDTETGELEEGSDVSRQAEGWAARCLNAAESGRFQPCGTLDSFAAGEMELRLGGGGPDETR